jgi:hypothetical protein
MRGLVDYVPLSMELMNVQDSIHAQLLGDVVVRTLLRAIPAPKSRHPGASRWIVEHFSQLPQRSLPVSSSSRMDRGGYPPV